MYPRQSSCTALGPLKDTLPTELQRSGNQLSVAFDHKNEVRDNLESIEFRARGTNTPFKLAEAPT